MILALARVSLDTHGPRSSCTGLGYGQIEYKIRLLFPLSTGFRVLCCIWITSFGSIFIDIDCCSSCPVLSHLLVINFLISSFSFI